VASLYGYVLDPFKRYKICLIKNVSKWFLKWFQVEFCGTVVKVSQPRMIEKLKRFRCATCKTEFTVEADITQNNLCPIPTR
jgi:hypothetical protein